MSEFKIGDTVRVVSVVPEDGKNGVNVGHTGIIKAWYGDHGSFVDFGRNIQTGRWTSRDGAYMMWNDQLEFVKQEALLDVFNFRHRRGGTAYTANRLGNKYRVTWSGSVASATYHIDDVRSYLLDGTWVIEDAPAIDPVATATAEVQRLLREQADAKAECDRIDEEQAKAEEKRRNIGKALSEARVALDKANHDAAGVQFKEQSEYILTTNIGNITIR